MWSSWLNPTSILAGTMAVVTAAYLAAVYLTADAVRRGEDDLIAPFRSRALAAGVVAGGVAIAGLVLVHSDAARVGHRLLSGPGLPALIVSVAAGAASLALLFRLTLAGRLGHFDDGPSAVGRPATADLIGASREGLLARAAIACLLAGFGFLTVAEAGWAHAIGVVALLTFVVVGFLAA